jgi:hypothetical protein
MRTTKHCAATPRNAQRKGSTAGSCVSAIVVNNILYIHNIELTFNQGVVVKLCIFVVDQLDLYEWNCGQEQYKIYTSESKFGKYVLQSFKSRMELRANMPCKSSKIERN